MPKENLSSVHKASSGWIYATQDCIFVVNKRRVRTPTAVEVAAANAVKLRFLL